MFDPIELIVVMSTSIRRIGYLLSEIIRARMLGTRPVLAALVVQIKYQFSSQFIVPISNFQGNNNGLVYCLHEFYLPGPSLALFFTLLCPREVTQKGA